MFQKWMVRCNLLFSPPRKKGYDQDIHADVQFILGSDHKWLKKQSNLLFKWADVPAIQSEDIQEASSI